MPILDEILYHKELALSSTPPSDLKICPKCHGWPTAFESYDYRSRKFLVIIDGIVKTIDSFLSRWECPLCENKFPYYPSFALPFKRYVKDSLVRLSERYLTDIKATYREVVKDNKMGIGYEEKDKQLAPSTVWRWVSYIGSLRKAPNPARQSPPPTPEIIKPMPLFPSWKHRSKEREKLLERAIRLLVEKQSLKLGVFPKFETEAF